MNLATLTDKQWRSALSRELGVSIFPGGTATYTLPWTISGEYLATIGESRNVIAKMLFDTLLYELDEFYPEEMVNSHTLHLSGFAYEEEGRDFKGDLSQESFRRALSLHYSGYHEAGGDLICKLHFKMGLRPRYNSKEQ